MVLIIAGCKASVRALPMAKSAGLWKNDMNIPLQRIDFTVIDSEGYRPNVGIILCNTEGQLFWAKRIGQHSWQFPQGGIRRDESPEQAMFRELAEEVGLLPEHVQVIGCTRGWLRYRLPKRLIRRGNQQTCIGQKQVWFLLRMVGGEDTVRLDSTERPEFDHWQWVDYWYPLRAVVPFKRHVYWRALRELAPLLFPCRPSRQSSTERSTLPDRSSAPIQSPEATVEMIADVTIATARPLESGRPTPGVKPAAVLLLRRTEIRKHPVITRMVVSARRGGVIDPLAGVAAPARESSVVASVMDEPRLPRPPAPHPRRFFQR